MNRRTKIIVNFVGFQVGWLATVSSAAAGMAWIGMFVVAMLVALHLALHARPAQELLLIAGAIFVGTTGDSIHVLIGAVDFKGTALISGMCPVWITALWINFAITLNVSLGFLQGRYLLAALLGAISGPMAYWAGAGIGALTLSDSLVFSFSAISVEYAVAVPLLLLASRRIQIRFATVRSGETALSIQEQEATTCSN